MILIYLFDMALIERIHKELESQHDEPRAYIGASSIGYECERSIWYGYHYPHAKTRTARQQMILEVGKWLERLVFDLLKRSGLNVVNAWRNLEAQSWPDFKGHIDVVWLNKDDTPKAVIEIKTAKDSSFNIFVKKGLRLWLPSYYDQIQSYMGMSGIHTAYIIVLNKNTGALHEEKLVFNQQHYDHLIEKAKRISTAKIMPPRISGSPSFYKCKMCDFQKFCHQPT